MRNLDSPGPHPFLPGTLLRTRKTSNRKKTYKINIFKHKTLHVRAQHEIVSLSLESENQAKKTTCNDLLRPRLEVIEWCCSFWAAPHFAALNLLIFVIKGSCWTLKREDKNFSQLRFDDLISQRRMLIINCLFYRSFTGKGLVPEPSDEAQANAARGRRLEVRRWQSEQPRQLWRRWWVDWYGRLSIGWRVKNSFNGSM